MHNQILAHNNSIMSIDKALLLKIYKKKFNVKTFFSAQILRKKLFDLIFYNKINLCRFEGNIIHVYECLFNESISCRYEFENIKYLICSYKKKIFLKLTTVTCWQVQKRKNNLKKIKIFVKCI